MGDLTSSTEILFSNTLKNSISFIVLHYILLKVIQFFQKRKIYTKKIFLWLNKTLKRSWVTLFLIGAKSYKETCKINNRAKVELTSFKICHIYFPD